MSLTPLAFLNRLADSAGSTAMSEARCGVESEQERRRDPEDDPAAASGSRELRRWAARRKKEEGGVVGVVGLFLAELDTGIFLSATNEILSRVYFFHGHNYFFRRNFRFLSS